MSSSTREHLHDAGASLLPWAPAAAWAAVIFAFSALPGSQVPGRFSTIGHLAEYAVLGALLVLPFRGRSVAVVSLLALVCAAAYGVTDELHQAFVPGRTPDLLDLATDVVGAAFGIAAALMVIRRRRRTHTGASDDPKE